MDIKTFLVFSYDLTRFLLGQTLSLLIQLSLAMFPTGTQLRGLGTFRLFARYYFALYFILKQVANDKFELQGLDKE